MRGRERVEKEKEKEILRVRNEEEDFLGLAVKHYPEAF